MTITLSRTNRGKQIGPSRNRDLLLTGTSGAVRSDVASSPMGMDVFSASIFHVHIVKASDDFIRVDLLRECHQYSSKFEEFILLVLDNWPKYETDMFCERHCERYIGSRVSGISLSKGCLAGCWSSIEQLMEGMGCF